MTFGKEVSFFESQPMFVCDQLSLKIFDANEAAEKLFGASKDELIGKRVIDIGERVTDETVISTLNKSRKDGHLQLWEYQRTECDTLYYQFSAHLICYKGNPAKFIIAHDVSDNVRKKGILHHKTPVSRPLVIDNFPMAEIEWNTSKQIIRWSEKAEKLFGWTEEEAIKEKNLLEKFVHPEDREYVSKVLSSWLAGNEEQVSMINRNITKEGKTIYCEWYNSLLYNSKGEVTSVYSMTQDVTDREEAMKQAQKITKSYQDLFNSISDPIYIINCEGIVLEANEGLESTYGYRKDEVIGKHYRKLAPHGKYDEEKHEEIIAKAFEGEHIKCQGWGKKKNGEVFPSEFLINQGNYFGEDVLIFIERNISDRKEYEEALKKREGLLSKLFNASPIGIALLNEHKEVEMVNEGFEHMFGYTEEELKGLDLDQVIVPEKSHESAIRLSESERVLQVTEKRLRKDGKSVDVLIYAVPVIVDKEVVGIYGIYVDITQREKAEERLKKSLKEKEVLLAEIHHRVKNNLAVITGLLELQSYSVGNETAKRILKDSQMRVNSIALVHEKLYKSENFSEIAVDQYLKELTTVIHQSMKTEKRKIRIKHDTDCVELPITQAIPCGLIVNEIITNSFKHAFVEKTEGLIEISLSNHSGNKLNLRLRDNGIGLPKQNGVNVKNSLGMTLIKTLAKQLNATYEYRNEDGAVFEFEFEKSE